MPRHNNREQVYNIRFGTHSVVKEASVVALNHKQAERMAMNFPNVKSVAKARKDYDRIVESEFKTFTTRIMEDIAQPKMSPVAMDEFLWIRRRNRLANRDKDKNALDK